MKNLTPPLALLTVPGVTGATVEASQLMQKFENIRSLHQNMVVIGQHAPGDRSRRFLLDDIQQCSAKVIHSLRGQADVRLVFVTGCGDEKMEVTVIGSMRWSVPWPGVVLAPLENFFTLFTRELPPDIG